MSQEKANIDSEAKEFNDLVQEYKEVIPEKERKDLKIARNVLDRLLDEGIITAESSFSEIKLAIRDELKSIEDIEDGEDE